MPIKFRDVELDAIVRILRVPAESVEEFKRVLGDYVRRVMIDEGVLGADSIREVTPTLKP